MIKKLELHITVDFFVLIKIKFGHTQISVPKIGIPMSKTACINPCYIYLENVAHCAKLNSPFLYEQIRLTIDAINQSLGIVKAVICDGNRNNQAFFRLFDTEPQQPWLTKGGIYLLFDLVHLLKNIRNNWLKEKMRELAFYERGMKRIARWSHLIRII